MEEAKQDIEENKEEKATENAAQQEDFSDLEPIRITRPADALPVWGKTFWYVPVCLILTAAGVIAGHVISPGIPSSRVLRYTYIVFGILAVLAGLKLFRDGSDETVRNRIRMGKLITDGVFRYVRNPQYAGVLFFCTGVLFISGNVYMYLLPIVYWAFLVILMKKTEEKWLDARFGDVYRSYRKQTRCWFPMKPTLSTGESEASEKGTDL